MCKVSTDNKNNHAHEKRTYTHEDMQVLDFVNDPIWVFDILEKRKWWANNAAVQFWNAETLEELLGRNFAETMSEVTHQKNLDSYERLKRNESWVESVSRNYLPYRYVSFRFSSSPDIQISVLKWTFYPDNKPQNVMVTLSGIQTCDGQLCMFCEAREVDENHNNEFLRETTMLRYLPVAVSQFDKDGVLMYQNPEACRVFGSPQDTRTSTTAQTEAREAANTKEEGQPHQIYNNQTTSFNQDQNIKETAAAAAPKNMDLKTTNHLKAQKEESIKQSQDETPRISAGTNICNSQTKEETVEAEANKFSVEAGTMTSNAIGDSHVIDASLRHKDDMKQENNEDKGTKSSLATLPSSNHFLDRFIDRQVGIELFEQILAGKDVNVECLLHTKAGPGWNAIHARLGKDAVSNGDIVIITTRDISDIVHAKKTTEMNLQKAEFFAIMAHEIRTPLFQVTGFIDLLDQTELDESQKDYVQHLKTAAVSLMTVINDVLDYSKLEACKMKLYIVPFEPRAVLEGSLAAVTMGVEAKGLKLSSSIATKIPVKLMGDPNRLRQILLNLLQNAVKFTHQGYIQASIDLINGDDNGLVVLKFAVEDTGIGIDSSHLSRVFREYNQAAPAIAAAYGGTGLGLSICKSLVQIMGGSMGVDSTIGKGSIFWFQIPFTSPKQHHEPNPANKVPEPEEVQERRLNVLVAEDNGVSQKLISKMLSRLGHQVKVVENGYEAVQEVQQQRQYDLILMDIQMPVMDGIDATKEIRCLGLTLPIVGLTASVRREDFENIGLNGWIGKPVRLKELQRQISLIFTASST